MPLLTDGLRSAMSMTVCSNGDIGRSSTVSANAPIKSRRREATVRRPLSVAKPSGTVPLIERVEPVPEPVPE